MEKQKSRFLIFLAILNCSKEHPLNGLKHINFQYKKKFIMLQIQQYVLQKYMLQK